ncbi:MobV family relaxase [Salinicoccus jeotgali]|uniref:Mobilization protein n=1 Tax=Salinicoccus jeotgali TaxID=381634 RepID=A0ABP7EQD2_9STAP
MSYSILRVAKVKGSVNTTGIQKHNQRENKNYNNKDIRHEDTYKNYDLINDNKINYTKKIEETIHSNYSGHRKIRSDAIRHVDGLITSDREFFEGLSEEETHKFFRDSLDFLEAEYGTDNMVYATVHLDENVPHMHFGFVPLTEDGRLSAKERLGNKKALTELQDRFNQYVNQKGYDLSRGTAKTVSEREHKDIDRFKKETQYHQTELQKVKTELKAFSERLEDDIAHLRATEAVEYENEVEVKKGLFTGREELETGRKVLSAEVFEELQETVSAARNIVDDYESIKNTDLYKQNESLKQGNLQLLKGNDRLQEKNREMNVQLDEEKKGREKAETFYEVQEDIVRDLYKHLRKYIKGFEKMYDTVKDKFLQNDLTRGSGQFMEIVQKEVHLEDEKERRKLKKRQRDDLEL